MKTARRILLCLVFIAAVPAAFSSARAAGVEDSLVEVLVTYQEYDPFLPWQKRQPSEREGYGVVVGDGLVFTAESLVRNETLIELRRAGKGEKIAASVVMADCRLDAALLRFDTSGLAAKGLIPVERAQSLPEGARVAIAQLDETRRVQFGDARVIQIAMKELPDAPYDSLTFSVLTDLDINRVGAPVFHEDKLAGILIRYDGRERTGWMLPYSLLGRFVDDAQTPPYDGVATAGFSWKELIDPAKRAYLGAADNGLGVQVLKCMPGSGAAEALRPNDVVLSLDGYDVDNLGFYNDPEYGRLSMSFLTLGRRRPGDEVPAVILREGKQLDVQLRLSRWSDEDALIPENAAKERPEYLIEGGFLLREMTGRFMRAHGGDWQMRADTRLVHLYLTRRLDPEKKGDRIVFLAGVLPDTINVGYHDFRNSVVEKVNGRPVRCMRDVFDIERSDGHIRRLTLQSVGVDLVLDERELEAANSRLSGQYRLSSRQYERDTTGKDAP